jgi:hypothetical protein
MNFGSLLSAARRREKPRGMGVGKLKNSALRPAVGFSYTGRLPIKGFTASMGSTAPRSPVSRAASVGKGSRWKDIHGRDG